MPSAQTFHTVIGSMTTMSHPVFV